MAAIGIAKEDGMQRMVEVSASGKTATRVFTVEFNTRDSPIARPLLALTAPGVPQYGDRHPFDDFLWVDRKNVKPHEGLFVYTVTCHYSTIPLGTGGPAEDPLKQKPDVEFLSVTSNEQIDRDINNKPITNSSEESYDPPMTEEKDDGIIRFVRNERYFDEYQADEYRGAINNDTFCGRAAGLVRCIRYDGNRVYKEDGSYYHRVTYEFQIRKDGWKRRVLDEGYREKTGTDGDGKPTYLEITDDNGQKVSQPVKLNGNGNKLDDGADAVFREHETRSKRPFSVLRIRI